MAERPHVLFIDNRDSFTFNLVDAFATLGAAVDVLRNDCDPAAAHDFARTHRSALIVLSPGPGRPEDAGCCLELVRRAGDDVMIFGVCLGHQVIVEAAGGTVARAPAVVHGKRSLITHSGHPLFAGIPSCFPAGRYHSLVATDVPDCLTVIGRQEQTIMAVAHHTRPWYGVQFHPESILTTMGSRLLANALALAPRTASSCIPS